MRRADIVHVRALGHDLAAIPEDNSEDPLAECIEAPFKPSIPIPHPKAVARALENARAEIQSPYIREVEVNCDECGGSGFDPGGIDPWGPEVCPGCHGARTQRIIRNYLAEAFQIAANPENTRPVERQHLIAVIQHCRQAVSALVSLPEVA